MTRDNHQLLERDLKYAFWQNHAIVDAAIGTFIEYGTTNRDKNKESYAELWHRWIYEDYYRTYMLPLEKYGIKIHHDDVAAGMGPHRQEELRSQDGAVLLGRLVGQLLADRGADGDRTSTGSSTSTLAGMPSSAITGSGTRSFRCQVRRTSCSTRMSAMSTRIAAGAAWCPA